MKLFSNKSQRLSEDSDASLPGWTRVFLYDDPHSDDHTNMKGRFKNYDGTQTCEMVCTEIAIEKGITPTMLHCFGMSIVDKSSKSYVWLSPLQSLHHVGMCGKNIEIHFRIRFIPDKSKLDNLWQLDEACFHYLVAQVTWDFLMDCLPYFVAREKEEEARGVSCLLILYKLRQDTEKRNKTEDNLKKIFENFDSFLPCSLKKSIFKGKNVLRDSMKDSVSQLITNNPIPKFTSTSLMQWFLRHILLANEDSYKESFVGYSVDIEEEGGFENIDDEPPPACETEKLHITVEMGQLNPRLSVITEYSEEYFNTKLLDLIKLEVSEKRVDDKVWWWVQIHRQDGHPKDIYFVDQLIANSFLTCLECYCRCVYDFYTSLCPDVKPSDLQGMDKTWAHGPVSEKFMKQVLMERNSRDIYILRTNPKLYAQYDVFYLSNQNELKSANLRKIVQHDGGYIVEGSTDPAVDIKELTNRLVQRNRVLPDSIKLHARRIKPTSKGCDLLLDILFENFQSNKEEEDEAMKQERKRLENQPKVYMETDIQKLSFIGSGYFTETHYGMLHEDPIVIKQLRADRIPDVDFRTVYQEFQVGFQKLMTLFDPKFFVTYYGVSLSTTPSMLIGGSSGNHGSLCHFMQHRKPSPMLSLHHLMEVCVQLASALEHMVNINCFHGNLHCDNVSVMKFDERYMIVKVTDPGLVSLYNKLPLTHEINKSRLPWLAPELHRDLSTVNMQTEVYAYSTTLWQMFSNGRSPLHHDPKIVSLNPDQIQGFFAQGVDILSCPDILHVQTGDPDQIKDLKVQLYKVMKSCWTFDPEERMEPRNILRELNCNMASYGEVYHKYNEISYFTHDVGSYPAMSDTENTSARDQRNSSGFHDTRHISVPDISVLRVERTGIVPGPSLPRPAADHIERSRSPAMSRSQAVAGNASIGLNRPVAVPQVTSTTAGVSSTTTAPGASSLQGRTLPDLPIHLIEDRRLEILEVIGSGHYGQVHRGKLKSSMDGINPPSDIVVKELKKEMRDKCDNAFKKEAEVMAKLDHPNIVRFYGMSLSGRYLVMEYLPNNSLIKYIKGQRVCKGVPFINLAVDITSGMAFLEDHKILHCDLAARNVLLTTDVRAKISDFGLSKMLPTQIYYYRRHDNQTIPIPWCSPEVIEERGKFTTKSDVWSFGVVLWEMYSYGKAPYLCNNVPDMLKKLHEGTRLPKSEGCPDEVYSIMKRCWDIQPDQRPSFHQCKILFQNMANGSPVSTVPPPFPERVLPGTSNNPADQSHHAAGTQSMLSGIAPSSSTTGDIVIDRKHLDFKADELLGKGAFGKVYKGSYNGQTVAIKECTMDEEYSRFKREFMLLYKLRNKSQNIVHFIGICPIGKNGSEKKFRYLMEYLPGGSLLEYLVKQKKNGHILTLQQRLNFLIHIAQGMDCLFNNRIIHCDLTASNVLLDNVGSKLVAKIGDFGWAKELDNGEVNCMYKRENPLVQPLWAAPEAIRDIYCKFSDIWSYGVVCVEVFKDGERPALDISLPVLTNNNGEQYYTKFYQAILNGSRYPKPKHCPDDVYHNVLLKCWDKEPSERIVYHDMLEILKRKVAECQTGSQPSSTNVSVV